MLTYIIWLDGRKFLLYCTERQIALITISGEKLILKKKAKKSIIWVQPSSSAVTHVREETHAFIVKCHCLFQSVMATALCLGTSTVLPIGTAHRLQTLVLYTTSVCDDSEVPLLSAGKKQFGVISQGWCELAGGRGGMGSLEAAWKESTRRLQLGAGEAIVEMSLGAPHFSSSMNGVKKPALRVITTGKIQILIPQYGSI